MRGEDICDAARLAVSFLQRYADREWSVPVPGLDFTVASVVAHAGESPLWYAIDLTGGPQDEAAFEVRIRPDASPRHLIKSLSQAVGLCATVVDAHPADARGFHPIGAADPSGFAAMACDEILVHTHDAGAGLDAHFRPPAALAARVLTRLFPWHEPGDDPWTTLLWANGRLDLPGAPRPRRWRWHCAPLATWDGTAPVTA
jgi:hypothetical protein